MVVKILSYHSEAYSPKENFKTDLPISVNSVDV